MATKKNEDVPVYVLGPGDYYGYGPYPQEPDYSGEADYLTAYPYTAKGWQSGAPYPEETKPAERWTGLTPGGGYTVIDWPEEAPAAAAAPAATSGLVDLVKSLRYEPPETAQQSATVKPVTPTGYPTTLRSASRVTTSTGTTTRSTWKPTGEMPTLSVPEYTAPEWDDREIRAMAQGLAGPDIRRLRTAVQSAMGQTYDNPNVRREILRQAMAGYGAGLGDVLRSAGTTARGEYAQKYQTKAEEARRNYEAQLQANLASYSNAFNTWLRSGTTVTTSGPSVQTYEGGTPIGREIDTSNWTEFQRKGHG